MNRSTTAPLVRERFAKLCTAMGVRKADGPEDAGAYVLDLNEAGWQIQRLTGTVNRWELPFGTRRLTAPEMFDMMGASIFALNIAKENRQFVTAVVMSPVGDPETITVQLYDGLLEDDVAENLAAEDQCAEEKETAEQMGDPFNNEPADYIINWNFYTFSMLPKEPRET